MLIDVLTQNFIHGEPFGSSLLRIFDFFETLIFARDRASKSKKCFDFYSKDQESSNLQNLTEDNQLYYLQLV